LNRRPGEKIKKIIPEEERLIKVIGERHSSLPREVAIKIEEHLGELMKLEFDHI
jgi:hypothetical protein